MSNPLIYIHIVIHAHIHIQQVVQYIFMYEQYANIYIQPYMNHHIHITYTAGCHIPRLNPPQMFIGLFHSEAEHERLD